MAKKEKEKHWDSVGWLFFFVWFLVLIVPWIIGLRLIVTKDTTVLLPIGIGVVLAAVTAGLIAWAVNSILQFRAKRRRISARKKARKK